MAFALDPEYSEMLNTPGLLDGSREAAIKSFQKQIDFHTGETRRLRYAQNSQLAISRLPAELLSGAFLYVVEAGLQNGDTNFAAGTFNFLQVCRRWNEVAVGFPGLWVWRISGAIKAWPLFKSRSKDAPLFLTWGPELPDSARELLTDTKTLKGIRQLNFSGTIEDLGNLLHAIGLGPLSNASAIRLKNDQYDSHEPPEHLTHFLSSPFPKLSKLDVKDFLPDFTSPMFTTSSLTTLKLCFSYDEISCTLSQFSQILQHHPNLRELDLHHDGIPQSESSEPLVPCVLPQLVYLRLYGTELAIKEFVEFIGMSSPLHNIVIRFQDTGYATISSLTKTIEKILAAYYGCPGLDYPRLADHLAISSYSRDVDDYLVFDARSDSTSTFRPMSNLKLKVHRVGNELVKKILPLFPLNHVRKFVDMTLALDADGWRGVLWKMENLSHLQLEKLNIESVLDVLYVEGQDGSSQLPAPELRSLTLSNLDILFGVEEKLSDTLAQRHERNAGLESLVVWSCRVHGDKDEARLRELVKSVTWEGVEEMGSEYDGEEEKIETEEDRCNRRAYNKIYYRYAPGYKG